MQHVEDAHHVKHHYGQQAEPSLHLEALEEHEHKLSAGTDETSFQPGF
jgi:hypothetical protein